MNFFTLHGHDAFLYFRKNTIRRPIQEMTLLRTLMQKFLKNKMKKALQIELNLKLMKIPIIRKFLLFFSHSLSFKKLLDDACCQKEINFSKQIHQGDKKYSNCYQISVQSIDLWREKQKKVSFCSKSAVCLLKTIYIEL